MKVECRNYDYKETANTANFRTIRDTLHLGRGWTVPSQQPCCATFLDLCNANAVCFLRGRNRGFKCYLHHLQALKLLEGGVNCNTVTAIRLCSFQRMPNKRDFRFSQRYCWRFKCSGMWRLVTGWVQSGHKSPCLRLCSSCHDTNNFRRSHDTAMFFRYKCQSQRLFEHASDVVCSTAVRAILLSCNGRCTNTLCSSSQTILRQWSGHGTDMVCPLSRDLNDTWQFALDFVKENLFPRRLPTVANLKNSYQRML
jgi:hypothetical protein